MSAFLKILTQFFILLIGILVFVFYQFTTPRVVFIVNKVAKAEADPRFQAIVQNYNLAHAERREAAIAFSYDPQTSRDTYVAADQKFNATRKQATQFIRETSDPKF